MKQFIDYLPDFAAFASMLLLAAVVDIVLHSMDLPQAGQYAGYLGTLLILVSFWYSARKRKLVTWGSPRALLRLHKVTAWLGPVLVLVHGGTHFNALLPWLAMLAMVVVVASGLTGSFLLARARTELSKKRRLLIEGGMSAEEAARALYQEALAVKVMKKWRVVHIPITGVFAVLALLHVVSVLMFRSW